MAAVFAPFNLRLLIVSVGNPPPLHESLHSAGHIILRHLHQHLNASADFYQPAFSFRRYGAKNCPASIGPQYSLVQSPTQMNVVGPWLASAWKEHATKFTSDEHPALVVLQDELELDVGEALISQWGSSNKGHNGIRSAQQSLPPSLYQKQRLARVRIGIGRPQERDSANVRDYVLRLPTRDEQDLLQQQTAPTVMTLLNQLEAKWRREYLQSFSRDAFL